MKKLFIFLIIATSHVKNTYQLSTKISLVNDVLPKDPFKNGNKLKSAETGDDSLTKDGIVLNQPGLDARQEIANYNSFLDKIFIRMNLAIQRKHLDPMDLKLLPSTKVPRFAKMLRDISTALFRRSGRTLDIKQVKGWLHGMSTLKRSGDVAIFIHENHRTIQCPFSLGPLELKVAKTIGSGENKVTKSARATTDLMLGYMDLKIDTQSGKIEITSVDFDEPGEVDIHGNLKKRCRGRKEAHFSLQISHVLKSGPKL
ncbi:uncharacterized protein [Lepeophtheirus salmonis]|uniref:uncharacterized protein n=1 Tax=Lepeophtheirus salmonis TaxID=72036 RepID=UPI001AE5C72A|nr:uncharacterized protein LOC121120451 [Lepeophtheirus salmonis]